MNGENLKKCSSKKERAPTAAYDAIAGFPKPWAFEVRARETAMETSGQTHTFIKRTFMIAIAPVRSINGLSEASKVPFFATDGSVTLGKYKAKIEYKPPRCPDSRDMAVITEDRSFFQRLFDRCKGIRWDGQRALTSRESRAFRRVETLCSEARELDSKSDEASKSTMQCRLEQMQLLMSRLSDPTATVKAVRNTAEDVAAWDARAIEDFMIVPAVADAVWKDKATLLGLVKKCKTIEDILALARTYPFDGLEKDGVKAHARGLGAMLDDDAIAKSMAGLAANAVRDLKLTQALEAIEPIAHSAFTRSRLLINGLGQFRMTALYEALCEKVEGHDDAVVFAQAFPYTYESCIEVILSTPKVVVAVQKSLRACFTDIWSSTTQPLTPAELENLNSLTKFVSGAKSANPAVNVELSNRALHLVWGDEGIRQHLRSAIRRCDAMGELDLVKPLVLTNPDKRFVELLLDPNLGYVPPNVIGDRRTTTHYQGLKPAVQRDALGGGPRPGNVAGVLSLLGS